MKPFVISPSSLSYRLLSTFHPSYRFHKEYNSKTPDEIAERRKNAPGFKWYSQPDVAKDFCSYWRSVALVVAILIIAIFLGYCGIDLWFNLPELNSKTAPMWVSLKLAFGLIVNTAVVGFSFVYGCMKAWPLVMRVYGAYLNWKDSRPSKIRYDADGNIMLEPSFPIRDVCRMAYRSYKEKYCPMVEYTNEKHDDSDFESY